MMSAAKLVGLLAEPDRRRVVAALILSAGDLDDIVSATGLSQREVVEALDRLSSAGLVETGADGVSVVLEESFKMAARAVHEAEQAEGTAGSQEAPKTPDEQVLARSIVDGRLLHLPTKRSKRLVVLDHLAQLFDPGAHYSEREVNRLLRAFDDDVAALRRYLVDEGFLDRTDGSYWRSGGTVEA